MSQQIGRPKDRDTGNGPLEEPSHTHIYRLSCPFYMGVIHGATEQLQHLKQRPLITDHHDK